MSNARSPASNRSREKPSPQQDAFSRWERLFLSDFTVGLTSEKCGLRVDEIAKVFAEIKGKSGIISARSLLLFLGKTQLSEKAKVVQRHILEKGHGKSILQRVLIPVQVCLASSQGSKRKTFQLQMNDTVNHVQAAVNHKFNISSKHIKVIFLQDRPLTTRNVTLADLKVKPNDCLFFLLKEGSGKKKKRKQ